MSLLIKKILNKIKNMQTETITNENGTAIKFGDGTMICYGTATNGSSGYVTVYYPAEFIDIPYSQQATIRYNSYASQNPIYSIVQAGDGLTNIYCKKMDGTAETNTSIRINWLVIGRWK